MQPFNYTINTGNAGDAFSGGYNRQMGMLANAEEFRKAQKLADAQQIANDQALERQREFAEVASNPTSDRVRQLLIKNPTLHEGFGKAMSSLSDQEKKKTIENSFSVLSALEAGNEKAALELIDSQIEAAKQSKDSDSVNRFEIARNSIISNPTSVRFTLKSALFANMGGKEFADTMEKIEKNKREAELQPGLVAKGKADALEAEAKASSAVTDAKYADEKSRTDISNTRSQIEDRKFDQRIKVMESALKREDNALKREELQIKIDDAKAKREETQRMKGAESDSAMSSIATTKGLLSDILKDEDTLRAATGAGAWRGSIPGTESRAMAGKIEQLQNALAAENLDRLKGAMSDKDIMFIKNISANLDRYQDEDKLVSELKRVQQVLNDAEARTAKKFGAQVPGDKKAEPVANDALSRLKQKYGVQ